MAAKEDAPAAPSSQGQPPRREGPEPAAPDDEEDALASSQGQPGLLSTYDDYLRVSNLFQILKTQILEGICFVLFSHLFQILEN